MKLTRIFAMLLVIWVGSLLTIGYLVAPVLFSMLDRTIAGTVAGQLFRVESILSLVLGVIAVIICNVQLRTNAKATSPVNGVWKRIRLFCMVMLVCTALGFFVILPWMSGLREQVAQAGLDMAHAPQAKVFGILHGVSSFIYLIEAVCGLCVCWKLWSTQES